MISTNNYQKDDRAAYKQIAGAVICMLLFIALAIMAATGRTQAWDEALARHVYALRSGALTVCAKAVTVLGNWYCVIAVCVILVAVPATRFTWGIPVSFAALASNFLRALVKMIAARPRPDQIYHLIEEGGWSFPSGHAATSVAVYGLLAYLLWRQSFKGHMALCVLCLFLTVAIGLSRVYLGVHYPCDVLGGWLAGLAILFTLGAVQAIRERRGAPRV